MHGSRAYLFQKFWIEMWCSSCLGKLKSTLTETDQGNTKELATDSVNDSHSLSEKISDSDGLYIIIIECLEFRKLSMEQK